MHKYTWERTPVVRHKWKKVKIERVPSHSEKGLLYDLVYKWNRKKSIKTFYLLYKHEFIGFNPINRVYHIIKHTVSGRYKELEQELSKKT